MTALGVRAPHSAPRLVGRGSDDYAQELQDFLSDLDSLASVVNTLISTLDIDTGGSSGTTVSGLGGGGIADVFLLMGA